MSDQNNAESSLPKSSAPYEVVLIKAFDKLTSQVLIFLLAYVILLIGVAVFGSNLSDTLRNLFYIIPILGVGAYVWLKQRKNVKQANAKSIRVGGFLVKDNFELAGLRSKASLDNMPDDVEAKVGFGLGKGKVVAVEIGDYDKSESHPSKSLDAQYLLKIFEKLDGEAQSSLIESAIRLEKKAKK